MTQFSIFNFQFLIFACVMALCLAPPFNSKGAEVKIKLARQSETIELSAKDLATLGDLLNPEIQGQAQ